MHICLDNEFNVTVIYNSAPVSAEMTVLKTTAKSEEKPEEKSEEKSEEKVAGDGNSDVNNSSDKPASADEAAKVPAEAVDSGAVDKSLTVADPKATEGAQASPTPAVEQQGATESTSAPEVSEGSTSTTGNDGTSTGDETSPSPAATEAATIPPDLLNVADGGGMMMTSSGGGGSSDMSEGEMPEGMTGKPPKDPLLSKPVFVFGISIATLAAGVVIGIFLAEKKKKKGIELYED